MDSVYANYDIILMIEMKARIRVSVKHNFKIQIKNNLHIFNVSSIITTRRFAHGYEIKIKIIKLYHDLNEL